MDPSRARRGHQQFIVGAGFAQAVVHDEPNTVAVLGTLVLAGGCASFGFALLPADHDVETRS